MTLNTGQGWSLVNKVMDLQVSLKAENFLDYMSDYELLKSLLN
jgi:hypothetical protein